MYRHSPVRNQRSKGIKIKHVLQVCLLVAVCFWLIFQVKRSHDKKKEFDATDTHTRSSDEVIKFGRKDLQPKLEETTKEVEIRDEGREQEEEEQEENKHEEEEHEENKHEEEDQEEHEENKHEEEEHEENKHEEEEHEENKHEEEEQDEDKIEEEKDDGGGGGDDDIDESEQEKSDMEIDREEVDTIDEDKETEESEEKENEEKDGQSQTENGVSLDDHDEDGATIHTHEAREEHYKADDASSAVTHDTQTVGTENENVNGTLENSSEDVGLVHNDETAKNGVSSNTTVLREIGSESIVTSLNATTSIDSHENEPPSNTTVITSDTTQGQNVIEGVTVSGEQAGNSSIATSVGYQFVPDATLTEVTEGSSNASSEVSKSNESTAEDSNFVRSETEVETDAGQGESLDTNHVMEGTEETLDSYETKIPDEVQQDTIDSTDPSHLEEKEVRTDLGTLPDIETEGGNSEDTAAE